MGQYDGSDFMFSVDGDLVIDDDGDLQLVHKKAFVEQSARHRVRISDPDWIDYQVDAIGANLEDLLGSPNTADTARKGIRLIIDALTRYDLIDREHIFVRPVPITKYVIEFYVFIQVNGEGSPIGFVVSFNLESGVLIRSA